MMRDQIFEYVKLKYHTSQEYPWEKYPNYAVLRHDDTSKWYGIIMNVPKNRLGLSGDEDVDIIDLKCSPVLIGSLRQSPGYLPAYHMNKEHWVSLVLDGTVPVKEIFHLLDHSYALTL